MSLADKKGVDLSSLNGDVSIEKIKQAGFDIKDTSKWLMELYTALGE